MNKRKFVKYFSIIVFNVLFLVTLLFRAAEVEITFSSDTIGDSISVFYQNSKNTFDDTHVTSRKINNYKKHTYKFPAAKDTEKLRIDPATTAGKCYIYKLMLRPSFFTYQSVNLKNLLSASTSQDITSIKYIDNAILLKYTASDPYFIVSDFADIPVKVDISRILWLSIFVFCFNIFLLKIRIFIKHGREIIRKIRKIIFQAKEAIVIPTHFMCFLMVFIYFSLPILFTYDSSVYFHYTSFFTGEYPLGNWGKTRGFVFPFFLWLTDTILGHTAYAFNIVFFILYLIWGILLWNLLKTLAQLTSNQVYFKVVFLLISFNPIFLGYYHIVLTEGFASTICIFYAVFICSKLQLSELSFRKYMYITAVTALCTVLLYFLKQMFFAIPIIAFFLYSVMLLYARKVKIYRAVISMFSIMLCLLVALQIWNHLIDSSPSTAQKYVFNPELQTQDTELFANYIKKGAINFSYNDVSKEIEVIHNNKIIDCVSCPENVSSLTYLSKCLLTHPLLLLSGYLDNYLVLSNFYTLTVPDNYKMSDALIVKEPSLVRGLENASLAEYPILFSTGLNTYEELGVDENVRSLGQYVDHNFVTQTLYSPYFCHFSNAIYTLAILYAPWCFIIHGILFLKNCKTKIHYFQLLFSGTVFFYGTALSIMCMRIDRYLFPVLTLAILSLATDLFYLCRQLIQKGKLIISRFLQ